MKAPFLMSGNTSTPFALAPRAHCSGVLTVESAQGRAGFWLISDALGASASACALIGVSIAIARATCATATATNGVILPAFFNLTANAFDLTVGVPPAASRLFQKPIGVNDPSGGGRRWRCTPKTRIHRLPEGLSHNVALL